MLSKPYCWKIALGICLVAAAAWGGTFGTVVPIGGQASDLALDAGRGVLYISNFTANRIEVMSLSNNTIQTSINVAAQPSALALSPDGRFLVVCHYGNAAPPASSSNALTVIDFTTNGKQTFALGSAPLGVAFGIDGLALVVTSTDFLLLDPVSGTTTELNTIAGVSSKTLPQPAASFPTNIVAASVSASADGLTIAGFGDTLIFRYDVTTRSITGGLYTASPPLGPRAVSVSQDGSYFTTGWALKDRYFYNISQFNNPSGALNIGTTAIDSAHNIIYAQIPAGVPTGTSSGGTTTGPALPILQIVDADNLAVRNQLNLPENFAGKSTLSSDGSVLYGVSDSGVMVLPVGALSQTDQVTASQPDLVFRGNFCNRSVATQALTIVNPGGGHTPFTISSNVTGLNVSPTSGVTPATITVSVDPNVFANQQGTVSASLQIKSAAAVNVVNAVRVLINSQQPSQRGAFVDIPGTLVDILPDPSQNRFYVLRQDQNQVLVYDGSNDTLIATLRTGNTPKGMAITFDQHYLLVGCDNSHYVNVFDLQTLQPTMPVRMFNGDYVQSLAASSNAILAVTRNASGGDPTIHRIDLATRSSSRLPSLGVFQNKIALNSVMVSSSNGRTIFIASSDGSVMLYDAVSDSFTVSRKDFTSLSGAYAASNFDQYMVGNMLMNSSLVQIAQIGTSGGNSSGFAFVDQTGYFTTAPVPAGGGQSSAPGTILQVNTANAGGTANLATGMVEAPLLGSTGSVFTRTVAPLYGRNAIINLTVSGLTVLPWNYSASVAPPVLNAVVSAADGSSKVAPGGLISIFGSQLSPVNIATSEIPLPTALANSCITVNGEPVPVLFVSSNQINAQMPFEAIGNVTLILRTPGGVSNNFNLQVLPNAPTVFYVPVPGADGSMPPAPAVIRSDDGQLVTNSHEIHKNANQYVVVYLTGLGQTNPAVGNGLPSPSSPLAVALTAPTVTLGGVQIPVAYYGLAPGEVGVYQINAKIPSNVPTGYVPLTITQGSSTTSVTVRVVD
ncbi:MAG TPA: hypothetical protein VKX49_31105 [Bryobacteraceae bacterium]|nr:hypothetical protein [Bryobacteraceae bacterium]